MRRFTMSRAEDPKGRSGTGVVLEGIVFSDGSCVVRWMGTGMPQKSTAVWNSYADFAAMHVDDHPKNSIITWIDENPRD